LRSFEIALDLANSIEVSADPLKHLSACAENFGNLRLRRITLLYGFIHSIMVTKSFRVSKRKGVQEGAALF
jgi:hypothetical protein